jgi:hypothetical protein
MKKTILMLLPLLMFIAASMTAQAQWFPGPDPIPGKPPIIIRPPNIPPPSAPSLRDKICKIMPHLEMCKHPYIW